MDTQKALAVGSIPSGLFIVCALDKQTNLIDGYLASWIQQVSFDPLLVSLAIKPGRPAYDTIKRNDVFSINIVGEDNTSFLKHFWKGYDPDLNPFNDLNYSVSELGAIILKDAKAAIVCKMNSVSKPGDHELVIAEVLASHMQNPVAKPKVHLRKSGLDY